MTVKSKPFDLGDRLLEFAVAVIKATYLFPKSQVASHIAQQLVRSTTSAGANYEEARSGQSKADFVHKMQLTLKELRESSYWIKLASRLDFQLSSDWDDVAQESRELLLIFAKSVATTKGVAR